MKKIFLLAILVTNLTVFAFSQIKQISSNDYWTVYDQSKNLIPERTNRTESKLEQIIDTNTNVIVTELNETLLPNKHRYLRIDFVDGKETKRLEVIRVDSTEYRRIDKDSWQVKDLRRGNGYGSSTLSGRSCIQYSQESDFVEGTLVTKYRSFEVKNETKGLIFQDTKFWIDTDGLIIKEVRISGQIEPRVEQYRTTILHEYNPKDLKIEVPIK
jgi:hypothetical protein